MKRSLPPLLAALALALASPAPADPLEDAVAARASGDYASALKLLQPLANQGAAAAQFNLGYMYAKGQGVTEDDAQATAWYRKAADQGYGPAQLGLAIAYATGVGRRPIRPRRRPGIAKPPTRANRWRSSAWAWPTPRARA